VSIFLVLTTTPYELIMFGALVDGYFGVVSTIPWYCLLGILFCGLSIVIRPALFSRSSSSAISL